ncbi:ABC transporter ATP-binding protein [uncultured Pseudodesulfovibrio sp.]|uniref:ABC transporter ATP-binding protein n=1 Tax=uncultured Pseudodesulfovibrio sp. TaxID=2035858 RepID=UPI0029C8FD80|nr:ABC transporter ATP-binding protein [uncultured Pseudodesulfovibrio sp.]
MPLIECRRASKVYVKGSQETAALTDLDLTIQQGEFTVLAGPSGSGKTTALNLIGGLDRPSSGSIMVHGKPLEKMPDNTLADFRLHSIGFIFQAYNLIPVLTAEENAEFILLLQGVPEAKRRRKVRDLFEELHMEHLLHRRPNDLSGGQQQRVAIIRAMAASPALIIADEPTANLDTKTSRKLLEIMVKINETRRTTFVFSSHDPLIIEYARRVVELKDGVLFSDTEHLG